jgi:hypothetical protein
VAALLPWCSVNRGSAERAVAESGLPMAETLTMMMLLRRAHNDTLAVPDWRTPALPQLAGEVRVDVRRVRRLLAHLERHGWVKRLAGRGRGRKSTYVLLPAPGSCDCHEKRVSQPPITDRKGGLETPFCGQGKGVWEAQEKGAKPAASSQVSPGIAPRAHQGEGVDKEALACIGGCGRAARRGCRTCWDHAHLEAVQ